MDPRRHVERAVVRGIDPLTVVAAVVEVHGGDPAARERTVIGALRLWPPATDHAMRERRRQHDAGAFGGFTEPAHLGAADQLARTVERERAVTADQIECKRER